jgi:hypothetical protein
MTPVYPVSFRGYQHHAQLKAVQLAHCAAFDCGEHGEDVNTQDVNQLAPLHLVSLDGPPEAL